MPGPEVDVIERAPAQPADHQVRAVDRDTDHALGRAARVARARLGHLLGAHALADAAAGFAQLVLRGGGGGVGAVGDLDLLDRDVLFLVDRVE